VGGPGGRVLFPATLTSNVRGRNHASAKRARKKAERSVRDTLTDGGFIMFYDGREDSPTRQT